MASKIVEQGSPFVAVATAGVANLVLMRSSELKDGISVVDSTGKTVGVSQAAAYKAIRDTAITRALLPVPILVFPPIIIAGFERVSSFRRLMTKYPVFGPIWVRAGLTLVCFGFALPAAISVFPQKCTIRQPELEDRFHQFKALYYNKGL
eukprot:TRINITY_DN6133_c0_g1_i1.p1 TRINITY_DN6133_c0_g1~~TRINITY_DN6133_c0_g1_i1.p1  ORF type:complete len:175 (+),score=22.28 TRINITY_DN6133_c0_g1_i1:78-527(+)